MTELIVMIVLMVIGYWVGCLLLGRLAESSQARRRRE